MKRKLFSIIGVAAFAVVVALNINAGMKSNAAMDVTLANVEALASGEGFGSNWNVTYHSPSHWTCKSGGSSNCPMP